jgi:hypothetical protein
LQFLKLDLLLCYDVNEMRLGRKEEHQGVSFGLVSGCSTDSVDVGSDVFGAIELENPVNFREIDTSGGNVCSEKDSLLTFKELVVDSSSLALLLSTVQFKKVGACFQSFECLVCISDLLAG